MSDEVRIFQKKEIEQPTILEMVPEYLEGIKILDIGCGEGIHLKKYIERGGDCYGIDINEEHLNIAKKECPNAKLSLQDVSKMDFEDEFFDIITISLVFDHIEDLHKAVREVKRVLSRDGMCIVCVPHPIFYMFRDNEKGNFVPTNSYFDLNKVHKGELLPDYPRSLEEYLKPFMEFHFFLVDMIESKPKEDWKERFPGLFDFVYNIPVLLFLKFNNW